MIEENPLKNKMSHDRLQQECYLWMHNTYPHLRKTFWAVINELKPYPGETKKQFIIRLNYLKSIGLVPGVLDFHFLHAGTLYCFDFKVGKDYIKTEQSLFISAITSQGGEAYEINTLDQFKAIINQIMQTK